MTDCQDRVHHRGRPRLWRQASDSAGCSCEGSRRGTPAALPVRLPKEAATPVWRSEVSFYGSYVPTILSADFARRTMVTEANGVYWPMKLGTQRCHNSVSPGWTRSLSVFQDDRTERLPGDGESFDDGERVWPQLGEQLVQLARDGFGAFGREPFVFHEPCLVCLDDRQRVEVCLLYTSP